MTIGVIYTALLALGIVYALFSAVFGWFADHDFGGVHVDASGHLDAGQPHPISGTILATFITGFGAGGTVAHYHLGWTLFSGLLIATLSGVVLAGTAFLALEFLFSRTQAGGEFSTGEAVGRIAEVITPIAADGIGEVAYSMKGQRERSAARSIDSIEIPRGRSVVIEKFVGATAYVRPREEMS
jgi:membrane protein implicated in regulation of membrane protease activity